MKNSEKYRNYVPYPFWAMDQEFFFKYANDLKGDDRSQLAYYPFKWAYVPPCDSAAAVEFLRDIGVEEDRLTTEAVAAQFENMTSFELLEQEGLEKYNEEALAVYQQALPDYEVIPIEASIQTNAGGAINCSSKEIPDINRMREAVD